MTGDFMKLLIARATALGLALLTAAPVAAQTPPADLQVLFWPAERRERDLRRMPELIPHSRIEPSPNPRPLPEGRPLALDPAAYMEAERVAGVLVIHDGQVRLERYGLGLTATDVWDSFSMTKSLTSTMVGAALVDRSIDSPDDPVTRYVPDIAGGAYDGVTVAQVLTMTSGAAWNEDYTNPASDIARFYLTPPPAEGDATVAYLKGLKRAHPPGRYWTYNTGETNLVGVLVARATGRTLSAYLKEEIWDPAGMEGPAFWMLDAQGKESGGCCVSARLRDWGRVGLMALERGAVPGGQIASKAWFESATREQVDLPDVIPGVDRGYGAQWWTRNGVFEASGIFGQSIHVDPERRLVVVILSAWPTATGAARSTARAVFIEQIKAAL